jgi:NDP-sugar pyrophosphorylase family protein
MYRNFRSISGYSYSPRQLNELRGLGLKIIPVLDAAGRLTDVLDLTRRTTYLPLTTVLMAGGRGARLRPLTDTIPKPLIVIGDRPILQRNIERLLTFGITDIQISLNYLSEEIKAHVASLDLDNAQVRFIEEDEPLGTIGALSRLQPSDYPHVLVMNADLLTDIDLESFYQEHLDQQADMSVATTPYQVKIPYAVIQTQETRIVDFKEKPTYTYYSNAGIYLIRREALSFIPKAPFDATDLIDALLASGSRVIHFPILGYWMDIGSPEDLERARRDAKYLTH